MEVVKVCPVCSKITVVSVDSVAYRRWQEGTLIQDAMPDKSATERESLISGMCPKCQADFFTEE